MKWGCFKVAFLALMMLSTVWLVEVMASYATTAPFWSKPPVTNLQQEDGEKLMPESMRCIYDGFFFSAQSLPYPPPLRLGMFQSGFFGPDDAVDSLAG